MSDDDRINLYINSKNRASNEPVSKFKVIIPNNLLRLKPNEYFTMDVNMFSCFNTWDNCMDGFNNQFNIIMYNNSGAVYTTTKYSLTCLGNPNVSDVMSNLNQQLLNKVKISYNSLLNKFIYTRTLAVDNNNYKMSLQIVNAEDFLGFFKVDRMTNIILPYQTAIVSNTNLNMIGDEAIIIKIAGDCVMNDDSVDNFKTNFFEASSIIFVKPIDVPQNGLLQYVASGSSLFEYKLSNVEQISWFELSVYNQDSELIPKFADYLLLLQFTRKQRENNIQSILKQLLEYIRQITSMIGFVIFPSNN